MIHDEWYLDQPIRLPNQQRGRVERLTPTIVVLADGTRWRRKDGRQSAASSRRIEPWSSEHTRSAQVAKRRQQHEERQGCGPVWQRGHT